MNALKLCMAYGLGLISGAILANYILHERYEQMAQADFEQRREHERKMYAATPERVPEETAEAAEIIQQQGYSAIPVDEPYQIEPREYGELGLDYTQIELTYYEEDDVVVENETRDILSDDEIAESIGLQAVDCFGVYEPDRVFIRNDAKKCEYEIIRVEGGYPA